MMSELKAAEYCVHAPSDGSKLSFFSPTSLILMISPRLRIVRTKRGLRLEELKRDYWKRDEKIWQTAPLRTDLVEDLMKFIDTQKPESALLNTPQDSKEKK